MVYQRYETNRIDEFLAKLESDQQKRAQGRMSRIERLAHALMPPVFITEAGGRFTLPNLEFGEGAWNKCFLNGMYGHPERKEDQDGQQKTSAVLRVPKIHTDWFYQCFDRFSRLATEDLAGHPSIVRMYGHGRDGQGLPYQILAREPQDLWQTLHVRRMKAEVQHQIRTDPNIRPSRAWENPYFSPDEIRRKMNDLLSSAEVLEELGFLQVDWKPENILVGEDGCLIATDLDFLLPLGADVETVEYIAKISTPEYQAPETQGMSWYDIRSSIYQLGLMFHSLMTLSMVISRNRINKENGTIEKAFAPVEDWLGKWYPQWVGTVIKATAYAPQDRYQTFQEFREGMETAYFKAQRSGAEGNGMVISPPANVSLTSSPSAKGGQ